VTISAFGSGVGMNTFAGQRIPHRLSSRPKNIAAKDRKKST
jgi:hypothetical protein